MHGWILVHDQSFSTFHVKKWRANFTSRSWVILGKHQTILPLEEKTSHITSIIGFATCCEMSHLREHVYNYHNGVIWFREAPLHGTILFVSDHNCEFSRLTTISHKFNEPSQFFFWSKPKTCHTIREGIPLVNTLLFSFLSDVWYVQ